MPPGDRTPRGMDNHLARYPELHDRTWLHARYVEERLTGDQMAELIDFDCTAAAVYAALHRWEIPVRGVGRRRP